MTYTASVDLTFDGGEDFDNEIHRATTGEYILTTEVEGLGNLNISSPSTLLTLTSKHGLETYYMDESLKDSSHRLLTWTLSKTDSDKRSVMVLGFYDPEEEDATLH